MQEIYIFLCNLINNQTFMNILQIALSTLISTGIITVFLSHWYDKKLRTHEIKLPKYVSLAEELARLVANDANWENLRLRLNEALLFASDEVVKQILEFNRCFTEQRIVAEGASFQMIAADLQPLIIAIRKDLDLKSNSIEESGLKFFQRL